MAGRATTSTQSNSLNGCQLSLLILAFLLERGKNMKRSSNKLIISIVTFGFIIIALAATTYAWFTIDHLARVNSFSIDVTAGDGIEISVGNANDWYSILSASYMNNYLYNKYNQHVVDEQGNITVVEKDGILGSDFILKELTSTDGVSLTNMYGGEISFGNGSGGFIEFDLHFRSRTPGTIYWRQVTLDSNGIEWVSDKNFIGPKGEEVQVGETLTSKAADAARISVAGSSVVVYENPESATNVVLNNTPIMNGAIDYYNVAHGYNRNDPSTEQVIKEEDLPTDIAESITSLASPVVIAELGELDDSGYHYATITVRIWLEGWDPNDFIAIANDILSVSLLFDKENIE